MPTPASTPDLSIFRLTGWVLSYALRRWGSLLAVLATILLKVALDLAKPWPMLFLVDYVLQGKIMPGWLHGFIDSLPGPANASYLIGWSVGAMILVFLLSWALALATAWTGISLGQGMIYDLAADLFARLQQLSIRFHTSRSVGDNLRRVSADCTCISVILKDVLLPALASGITLIAMFVIMWRIDAVLTLLSLAVVPYMIFIFHKYAQPMLELSWKQQEIESKIYEQVEQTFAAIPVIQAFTREELNARRFASATGQTVDATVALTRVQLRFKIFMGLATAVGTAAILWLGVQHALEGHISLGTILLFLSYLGSLYAPLEAVMYSSSTMQGAAGSARRVLEVLEAEREIRNKPGATALGSVQGRVQFENVTFGYRPEKPVLSSINLEVLPGQSIALVGPTGVGKSTLVGLLPRFFDPWKGRVLVDGHDLRDVTLKSLREQIALVLQEPFLFPMSVAENIAYGRPRATLEEIKKAAQAARADDFIMQLPKGYYTPLGERGATLSVGQRQRISIARALLKDAPLLILDEPTSALDAETEQLLMQAIEQLIANKTTLIIAHRLSTVRRADRIAFLQEGAIAESGTHQELMERGGLYAAFHKIQFKT